jgi:hypothetical protein
MKAKNCIKPYDVLGIFKPGAMIGSDCGNVEIVTVEEATEKFVVATCRWIGTGRQGKAKFYNSGKVEVLEQFQDGHRVTAHATL